MRNRLFLFEALTIVCGIIAAFAFTVFLANLMLSNTVQEQARELAEVRAEMRRLQDLIYAAQEVEASHEGMQCQLDMLMVASRGGWQVAQVVFSKGLLESCTGEANSD